MTISCQVTLDILLASFSMRKRNYSITSEHVVLPNLFVAVKEVYDLIDMISLSYSKRINKEYIKMRYHFKNVLNIICTTDNNKCYPQQNSMQRREI